MRVGECGEHAIAYRVRRRGTFLVVGYTLARATTASPLTIESGVVRWAGPSDPEEGAPLLRFEARLEEAEEIGDLVARCAMPVTLIAALAERFVDVSLDVGVVRWRRALAAARIARGEQPVAIATGEVTVSLPGPIRHARVERDGAVLATSDSGATIRGRLVLEAPVDEEHYMLAVPPPRDPACRHHVAVSRTWEGKQLSLVAFDRATGAQVGSYRGIVAGNAPEAFSVGETGWWLHDEDQHIFVGGAGEPFVLENSVVWTSVGGWLLVEGDDDVWHWHDLARREQPRAIELADSTPTFCAVGDVLWIGCTTGLYRAAAGAAPERIFEGRIAGLAVEGDRAWLGTPDELIAIDVTSGRVRWRTKLAHGAWEVTRIAAGVAAGDRRAITVLDDAGQVLVALGARTDHALYAFADGTTAVSSGEHVAIIAPDGVVHRPMLLPYDGKLLGATVDRFIFGPVAYDAISAVRPDAFYALDRTGAVTARLPIERDPPLRFVGCSDAHVYLTRGRALLRWDPNGAAGGGWSAPPARRPVERGGYSVGEVTVGQREDNPTIGREIAQDALVIEGTYGGSTGRFACEPILVSDGAVATFFRCDLTIGDPACVIATRGATAILVACRVPANVAWMASADSHLVMIDCVTA